MATLVSAVALGSPHLEQLADWELRVVDFAPGHSVVEALASGVPIAAFPVTGPKDVVGDRPIGVLDEDLGRACMEALQLPRDACRAFALGCSWENSARQFLGHVRKAASGNSREVETAMTVGETAAG